MTIIFDEKSLDAYNAAENQVMSLCKMFFPCVKIIIEMHGKNSEISTDTNILFARIKNRAEKIYLLSIYIKNGEVFKQHKKIDFSEDKKYVVRELCKIVYKSLSDGCGVELSWGILTGIRPVKIAVSSFENGLSVEDVRRIYKNRFLVGNEKIDICIETAKNQKSLFSKLKPEYYSLYIGIPFCPSKCKYCSFVSHSTADKNSIKLIPEYMEKLCLEIKKTAEITASLGLKLLTIYIGGGTPTAVSTENLKMLLSAVRECFDFSHLIEYTVEAGRPDTLTKENLEILYEAGIDRISVNPQTFSDDVLLHIGRNHKASETVERFYLAREIGFTNINMDLIAGLPGDSFEKFRESLFMISGLSPDHITVHTLSIKRSSEMFTNEGLGNEFNADEATRMIDFSEMFLKDKGYAPYYLYRNKNTIGNLENVGYAKKGFASYYNAYIMEENHTILAVGAGAVTKFYNEYTGEINRTFNFKYPYEYISKFNEILNKKEEIYKQYGAMYK